MSDLHRDLRFARGVQRALTPANDTTQTRESMTPTAILRLIVLLLFGIAACGTTALRGVALGLDFRGGARFVYASMKCRCLRAPMRAS